MKFFIGLLSGALITFAGLYGFTLYLKTPSATVSRCIALYQPTFDRIKAEDPTSYQEVQEQVLIEGFATIEELIRDRCETFVKNGQQF